MVSRAIKSRPRRRRTEADQAGRAVRRVLGQVAWARQRGWSAVRVQFVVEQRLEGTWANVLCVDDRAVVDLWFKHLIPEPGSLMFFDELPRATSHAWSELSVIRGTVSKDELRGVISARDMRRADRYLDGPWWSPRRRDRRRGEVAAMTPRPVPPELTYAPSVPGRPYCGDE